MLMRNTNTGAFEVYDISQQPDHDAAPMGQVGTGMVGRRHCHRSAGHAADAQLTQAMAGLWQGGFDTSSPLGPAMVQSVTPAMLVSGNTTSHQA